MGLETLCGYVEIERAHHTLTQLLNNNRKSGRPVHVAFLSYTDKMKILVNAAARLNPFQGNLIGIGTDFSKETQDCRKALVPFKKHIQKKIKEQECKVFIDYPATLKYLDSKDKVKAVKKRQRRAEENGKQNEKVKMLLAGEHFITVYC